MRVLVVEDERDLNRLIKKRLKEEGLSVDACYNGEEALDYLASVDYDLLISDIMMPKMDGIELVKRLREMKKDIPFIFLSAKDAVEDRVGGLDAGADDYLIKPFAFEELLARVRVLLRKNANIKTNVLKVGDLSLNLDTHLVKRGDKEIELSSKEFNLLSYMMLNSGIVLSREKLEEHVWDFDFSGSSNVIDVYIRYLRKKIYGGFETKLIKRIRGGGYTIKP